MAAPLISVVTPTKNRRVLLRETMDSVQHQTLPDWEHIIVDDGSDDGTAEEVARRAAADPRVRYMPRAGERSGANVCRNQGLAAARADLVVFLDSDDLLDSQALERRVAVMQRNQDLDFAVFRMSAFLKTPGDLAYVQSPDLLGDDLLAFLFFEFPWQTTGPTWRRKSIERLGGFDESLASWQDVDLHVRAIAAGCRYLRLPEIDYHMRWQEEPTKISTQQRRSPAHLKAAEAVVAKFERAVREGPGMTWMRQRAICSLYFYLAERWIAIGQLRKAVACWKLVRSRGLGSLPLYLAGTAVLALESTSIGRRIGHKWKGWARLRQNPELVRP